MKPYHLQVRLIRESDSLDLRWFGQSTIDAEGSVQAALRPGADATLLPDPTLIDLQFLLDEIVAGKVSDEPTFQAANEFLLLRDLLADDDFEQLGETLYHFLWREARRGVSLQGMQRGHDGNVWIDPDRRLVRVWFATDRKPVQIGNVIRRFDPEESAQRLTYGACVVFIPQSHKPGSTGTAWWRRWIQLESDDSLQLRGAYSLPRDVFWAGVAGKFATWWKPGQRNMFVLIHGFNVSFEEAAVRAAQIGYDLKVPGEMAFYSWPSRGSTAAYTADEATITASVPHIAQFLHELSEQSGAERIHLFVHSMGNRGFLRALERLVADARPTLRLGQVFFCAPDEDVRTFKDAVNRYPHSFERRTLLVSPDDRAVFLSRWKHRYDRVGYVPPVTVMEGIETIQVGGFSMLDLGHGYFASAAPVVEDIREAIETGRPASERTLPRVCEDYFAIDIRQH